MWPAEEVDSQGDDVSFPLSIGSGVEEDRDDVVYETVFAAGGGRVGRDRWKSGRGEGGVVGWVVDGLGVVWEYCGACAEGRCVGGFL